MILRADNSMGAMAPIRVRTSAAKTGVVHGSEGLHVVFRLFRDHHAIDENSRYLHLARIERSALGHPFHLGDDDPARIVRGHGDGEHFYRQRLALHGDIALGIRGGAADNAHVDRKCFVGQVLLAVDGHQLDEILGGAVVDFTAAVTRIDVGSQPDFANVPGAMRGNIAKHMRDHALGQIVSLDLAADRQRAELGHQAPMSAYDALH